MAALQVQEDVCSAIQPQNTVIVTGFGPFKDHTVNASWEAVRLLPATGIEKELDIFLITEKIEVSYKDVETRIPQLWDIHNPLLVIHVGVSSKAKAITLEQMGQKAGYIKPDVYGCYLETSECCRGSCPVISSTLDVEQLSKDINDTCEVKTCLSSDAGRYLCDYTYYTSLSIDNSRSLFVHVPPLGKPYSAEQLANCLADILRRLVPQLRCSAIKEAAG